MQEKDIDKLLSEYHDALDKAYKSGQYELKYYINEFPEEVRNLIQDINRKVDNILTHDPNNIEALHLKLNIILRHNDNEQMKIIAQRALEIIDNKLILNPEDLSLYYKKLEILEDIDRNHEAKKLASNILKLCGQRLKHDKNNIEIMIMQAQICGTLNLYRKKKTIIKKILKIDPSNQLMKFELNFVNDDIKQSNEKIMVAIVYIALIFVIWLYYMIATQLY